jgi:hypothetical protein
VTNATVDAEPVSEQRDVRAQVAASGKGAARIIARGLKAQARAEAAARKRQADAAAARARDDERALRRAEADERRRAKRARNRAWRAGLAQDVGRIVSAASQQAAAGFSLLVYVVVVYVAATSQMQVFRIQFGWTVPRAAAAAIFIEGLSLAFALTAHALRLRGERAFGLRALTWAAALFAGAMNYAAHVVDPNLSPLMAQLQAIAVGVSSLAGIVLWEARSGARSRAALRAAAKKALPKPFLGWDFYVRYPRRAFWAWSAMVADPEVRTREDAIEQGQRLWNEYRARKAARALVSSWWARRQRLAVRRRARSARKALLERAEAQAHAAVIEGHAGPAVVFLRLLAACETIRPEPMGMPSEVLPEQPLPGLADTEGPAAVTESGPAGAPVAYAAGLDAVVVALEAVTARLDVLSMGTGWPTDGPDLDVAGRWRQRLDELDAAYRAEDGTALPIPGRRQVIARMAEFAGRRFAWGNHDIVDQARRDLLARRSGEDPPVDREITA